ncbi:1-aminocyclopropane-1-carboxylate synthase-like [Primulina eburnea]|uniref:1-aminocyclopropane-1-carboxylate synthase-like n=1 Tax=Primulina eburnea TaxID=1245227 RepID=UPI003C6BED60
MELKGSSNLSKLATRDDHGENSLYFEGWKAYDNDPFHPTSNREGVIQMGVAENQLSVELFEDWIKKNPRASICTPEGVHAFKDIASFQDYHGLPQFRNAVAKLMEKVRGGRASFDPERIVIASGATGASEMLMFSLADRGDGFLVPSPCYPAFDRDLRWRTRVQLLYVECESRNNFRLTKQSLEDAYENARKANIEVKGLIIANPSNPLGTTMDKATFKMLVNFINDKKIHLVCDEIYSATVFRGPKLVSVSEIIEEMECDRGLIHIVYSLSKDMGIPGFRVGIVYSYNDKVVSSARKMSSFGLISSQTQYFLAFMLSDEEFVEKYLTESAIRLANQHDLFTKGLEEMGIKCLESNAGVYVWMDLRPLLKEATFEGEMDLWRVIISDVKLNVSPGSSFHCHEPGWFRVCFANMDIKTMRIALARIRKFVVRENDQVPQQGMKQKKSSKGHLTLSFPSPMYDENWVVSLQSPHSPLPQSPLLSART